MGLASPKKEHSALEEFSFRVDDIFSIQGRGVVLAGQITKGTIHKGDVVTCITGEGCRFLCRVWEIEQPEAGAPGRFSHPEAASADGPFNGRYALGIAERSPDEFHPGDQLVSGKE